MTAMPQTRRALLAAAQRHYSANAETAAGSWRAPRRRTTRRLRPLILGSTSGVVAATVAAVLLLSAGGAPTAAQALPILATRANPAAVAHHASLVRMLQGFSSGDGASWPTSWGAVHQFSLAATNLDGYVVQSTDGSTICMVLMSTPAPASTTAYAARTCATASSAEQQGMLLATPDWTSGDYNFVVLVPSGGAVTLTDDGTTTTVPVTALGIAGGVVHDNGTISLQVGSSVQTSQVGPSAQTAPAGPSGSTASTGAAGATT
jgi:hypothetical protein